MGMGRVIDTTEFVKQIEKAIANGVATLDASAKVPKNQISLTAGDVGAIATGGEAGTALKLTAPRAISATGDATYSVSFDGSVNVSGQITLASVNSNAGSFGSAIQTPVITVDAKGRITAVSVATVAPTWASIAFKPTTLSGYGITDAQPLGNELTAIQSLADTAGFLRKTGDGTYSVDTSSYLPSTGGTLSGNLLIPFGTAAIPAIQFSGDTNTGIYRISEDSIGVSTGGTAAISINNSKVDVASTRFLEIDNTTASTSTTTGALICLGGAGFSGAVYASSFNGSGSGLTALNASNISTGSLNYLRFNPLESSPPVNDGAIVSPTLCNMAVEGANGYPMSGHLLSSVVSTIRGLQIISSGTTPDIRFRTRHTTFGTGWSPWYKILTNSQPDTGWTASTGTQSKAAFNTETVTLIELARQFHAVRTVLINLGLIGT